MADPRHRRAGKRKDRPEARPEDRLGERPEDGREARCEDRRKGRRKDGSRGVDALHKIRTLSQSAQYDLACACGGTGRVRGIDDRWIYPAALPDGGSVFLLKVLLSNACANDCSYCVNRASNAFRRTTFSAEELAGSFLRLWESGRVGGLFLSSGIIGGSDRTMERMIKTVEILRLKHRFRGYIHLKILPGAGYNLVERAVQLATRVSINLEAPNQNRLSRIAGDKDFRQDLLLRMKWIKSIIKKEYSRTSKSQTTQFVVGAADESDREIVAYDNCSRTYTQVTDNTVDDTNPTISGNCIAWTGGAGDGAEIYYTCMDAVEPATGANTADSQNTSKGR